MPLGESIVVALANGSHSLWSGPVSHKVKWALESHVEVMKAGFQCGMDFIIYLNEWYDCIEVDSLCKATQLDV